jgi:hypothetical protein
VKQSDQAGNTSDSATASWTVDLTKPDKPGLSGQPPARTNQTAASINFTGEQGATFTCSVDGGDYQACTSPKTLSVLSDGLHSLSVKQTDQAGNTGPATSTTWTIDTVALAPETTQVPATRTNQTTAVFEFRGESGAIFVCGIDSRPLATCATPKTFTGLAAGAHVLHVEQTDSVGNVSPQTNYSWFIDLTPPAMPTITAKPLALINAAAATFSFIGEAGATFSCSLDKKPWADCTSNPTFMGLADGPHSLQVKQIDEAGNTSTYAASASWTVDTRAPVTPLITGHPLAITNSKSAAFAFGKPETGATSTCSIDSATFVACASGKLYSGLADGQHLFALVVTDKAGNVSIARTFGWLVDTVRPTLAYNPVDSKAKTKTQTIYNLTLNDDASGIGRAEYSISVKAPALTAVSVPANTVNYASPVIFKTVAAIRWLRVQDKAGNWSNWYPA